MTEIKPASIDEQGHVTFGHGAGVYKVRAEVTANRIVHDELKLTVLD
jgi:hypothetical protein